MRHAPLRSLAGLLAMLALGATAAFAADPTPLPEADDEYAEYAEEEEETDDGAVLDAEDDAAGAGLDQITVTAQKRAQRLQEVPAAIHDEMAPASVMPSWRICPSLASL